MTTDTDTGMDMDMDTDMGMDMAVIMAAMDTMVVTTVVTMLVSMVDMDTMTVITTEQKTLKSKYDLYSWFNFFLNLDFACKNTILHLSFLFFIHFRSWDLIIWSCGIVDIFIAFNLLPEKNQRRSYLKLKMYTNPNLNQMLIYVK